MELNITIYDTLNEVLEQLKKPRPTDSGDCSEREKEFDFNDFNSIEEFIENFSSKEVSYETDKILRAKEVTITKPRLGLKQSMVGGHVNMANYLSGHPRSMYETKVPRQVPVKNFIIMGNYLSDVSADDVLKRNSTALSKFMNYKHNKTIHVMYVNEYSNDQYHITIIDLTKLFRSNTHALKQMFASADAFRRLRFGLDERSDLPYVRKNTNFGYGRSVRINRLTDNMRDCLFAMGLFDILVLDGENEKAFIRNEKS